MKWKWLFWLLLAVNGLLFGYFELSKPLSGGMQPGHEPIAADKMKLLTESEVAAMPKTAVPDPVSVPLTEQPALPAIEQVACYEWGSFTGKRIERARTVIDKLGLESKVETVANREAIRYWVYIPPLPSFEEAQARNEALHSLGIDNTFIVKDAQWRNAISFGVFKDENLATRLAGEMRNRGVTDVVKAVRNQEGRQFLIALDKVPDSKAEEIRRQKPDFPYSELKQVECK
jgi:hypothetical protein